MKPESTDLNDYLESKPQASPEPGLKVNYKEIEHAAFHSWPALKEQESN